MIPKVSSPVDSEYDFGFGEILEYREEVDTCSSPYDHFPMSASSFDGKGKAAAGMMPFDGCSGLDQYHPENSKREVIQHVVSSLENSGEIHASQLQHSSEQWSNYRDLCDAVRAELRRTGYGAATVDCIQVDSQRRIVYKLS